MPARNAQSAELGPGVSRPIVLLLAFTCGAALANLYYAQPLLRQRMLLGATAFGCFSVTLTSVAFLLSLLLSWAVLAERAMTGRLPIGADSAA